MKIQKIFMWTLMACLMLNVESMILNNDQLKALKLARPFLTPNSITKMVKNKKNTFLRNKPRNLMLIQSDSSPVDIAKQQIVTEALDVRL